MILDYVCMYVLGQTPEEIFIIISNYLDSWCCHLWNVWYGMLLYFLLFY